MAALRNELIKKLEALPDLTVRLWKNSDLLCVYFKDKEVAHFQNDFEIDIRLTPALIKQKALVIPKDTSSHPDRAKNSRWIVQAFQNTEQLDEILELVELATTL